MAELKKTCTKCQIEKPLDGFSVDKGVHGRRAQCRTCINAANLARLTPQKKAKRYANRKAILLAHPLYNVWACMKKRCQNKNSADFHRYGGRGIKVCPEWQAFAAFEADMMPSYKKGLSLDRIDNNGDYSPENCRWATVTEQANNTRKVRALTYMGKTMGVKMWARHLGLKYSTLSMRLHYGWPVEKALSFTINK